MLARIAQELFWLGRDLTRAEHTARMLDGAFHADVAGTLGQRGIALSWDGVLAIIGAKPPVPGERKEAPAAATVAGEAFDSAGPRTRGDQPADARSRQPGVDPVLRRPRARARSDAARRDLDRDVASAELLLSVARPL